MDLLGALWRAKTWIVILAVVGALAGAGLSAALPERWTATALVQVGQIGQVRTSGPQLVETPTRAVERVRDVPFLEGVLRDLGLPTDEEAADSAASLIRTSLRVNLRRGSDLLEIQVAGATRDDARKYANAIVSRLASVHADIAEPGVQRLRSQHQLVESELAEAAKVRAGLFDSAAGLRDQVSSGQKFSESVLLGSLVSDQDARIRQLRETRVELEEQLSPRRTFPTALLSAVHVPARRSSPKLLALALAGAIVCGSLGLLLGVRRRNA